MILEHLSTQREQLLNKLNHIDQMTGFFHFEHDEKRSYLIEDELRQFLKHISTRNHKHWFTPTTYFSKTILPSFTPKDGPTVIHFIQDCWAHHKNMYGDTLIAEVVMLRNSLERSKSVCASSDALSTLAELGISYSFEQWESSIARSYNMLLRQASEFVQYFSNCPVILKDLSVLGFKNLPSLEELRSRYRSLAKQNHPDVGGKAAIFQKIQKAYEHVLNFIQT